MTALTTIPAQISPVFPMHAEIYPMIAAVAIEAGDALYLTTSGTVGLADANGSGTLQFRGIALNKAGAGQAVGVLKRGHVYGFGVSGLAYDAPVYVSNTEAKLDDTAGGTTIHAGRVVPMSDSAKTKVLYVEADWLRVWA